MASHTSPLTAPRGWRRAVLAALLLAAPLAAHALYASAAAASGAAVYVFRDASGNVHFARP